MTADCSQSGTSLPACSVDFSNNQSATTIATESGTPAIQIQDTAAPKAATLSNNDGVKGNKGIYGLPLLQAVKLAEFPGISFAMKLATTAVNPTDTTTLADVYLNYTISPGCDGDAAKWLNLVTTATSMRSAAPADADGYISYSATINDPVWTRSGSHPLIGSDGATELLPPAINTIEPPVSLAAMLADPAYAGACIWNYSNPNVANNPPPAAPGVDPTPGVVINLGDSNTVTDKLAWLKNLVLGNSTIGLKQIF